MLYHDRSAIVEIALQYAGRGWSILPMRSKRLPRGPIGENATRDPAVIARQHWIDIGLACGEPSGVDVLDIDDPAAFALNLDALIASTLAASTPSGGVHLFFKHVGIRSRAFPWGVSRYHGRKSMH